MADVLGLGGAACDSKDCLAALDLLLSCSSGVTCHWTARLGKMVLNIVVLPFLLLMSPAVLPLCSKAVSGNLHLLQSAGADHSGNGASNPAIGQDVAAKAEEAKEAVGQVLSVQCISCWMCCSSS